MTRAPDAASGHDKRESWWLIERSSDEPGRPLYWIETGEVEGVGTWTSDPWAAARYVTQADAERTLHKFIVHPTVLDARAVEHGFEDDDAS